MRTMIAYCLVCWADWLWWVGIDGDLVWLTFAPLLLPGLLWFGYQVSASDEIGSADGTISLHVVILFVAVIAVDFLLRGLMWWGMQRRFARDQASSSEVSQRRTGGS